jgi:putative addiction module CopG family antidote
MATMNVSLPNEMKTWVEFQAQNSGRYTNTSDYVRDLIRKDQDTNTKIQQMQNNRKILRWINLGIWHYCSCKLGKLNAVWRTKFFTATTDATFWWQYAVGWSKLQSVKIPAT